MRKRIYLVIIFLIAVFAYTKNTFAESECVNPNGYRSARIHLMYGDVELTTDSEYPGGFYSRYESENNAISYLGANSAYYCRTVNLPGNMFVNDEVGILDWYDNPEFTGKPVYSIYVNSDDIYLYAKTAPAVAVNISGRKKRMLVGKKYDTTYVDSTDYNVDYKTEIIDEYDENNNVIGKAHVRAYYRTLIPSDRTVTVDNINTASYFNKIYYYPRGVDNNSWYSRTRSYTFTYVFGTNKTTYPFYMDSKLSDTDWELSQINKLYYITPIPKYYKYVSYIDENGNEYDPYNFIPTAEYAGLNLTPVFDTKETCGRYTVESYLGSNGQLYPEHAFKEYQVLDDDLDGKYIYRNNKERVDVNTCIDHGLTIKSIYTNVPEEDQTTYKVIYPEGNDIVEAGSLYTLPQTTKDISIRHIIYLKYQDGVTEDSNVIFHVVREYDYWTVDGVRYEPGDQIVINKDTLLIPKYKIKSIGNHDLPEPVRSNYRFVGWFDAPAGGNLIDYFDEGFPERYILYAHWVPSDKVFVVRPDNIVVYLERGSKYKLPGIPSKEPVTVANIALDYNDGSGMVKQSRVMKYYDPDGYTLDGQKYYPDQNYVVNHDTWLIPEYKERIEAVTFNSAEKEGASFLGWYDDPVAGNKYTSYSGTQDLTLYAHWGDAEEYVTITTPDQSYEVLKGSSFVMPSPSEKTGESFPVTFNFNYSGAPDPVVKEVKSEYIPNGWFYEDQHFDVGEVIIAENDMTLTPDYVENIISPEFPSTPERIGYKFDSWRNTTASSGYKTYNGFYGELAPITLYAKWNTENYYYFPELPAKDDEVVAHLTLKYQDGVSNDKVVPIYKKYTPDCWTINSNSSCFKPGQSIYVPGKYIEGKFPRYIESYSNIELYNETREGYYFLGWYDSPNGGTKYTSYSEPEDLTLYARWSTTPPDEVVCQRATTLHTSNGKAYGQIGTPGTLVPGDAFDCDVNGDGVYDAETERFYYVNDHYDPTTGTYDNDYASFIYYTDYINQTITNTSDTSTFSKWAGTEYYGPDAAIAALPTYSDWPNVNVYQELKYVNTPLGYTYNQVLNNYNIYTSLYADYEYSSARLLNAKELMDSGCIYEYNLGDGTYYNINSTCNFLVENVRTNINDPLRETGYWTESFGDLCIENSCEEKKINAWELILDNGQTSWSGAHIQERGAYYDRGVRPVIDVAKTKLGEDIQPTRVHTITFPEGKVLNALHNSKFEFGGFNGTTNTEYNVTFNYNDGVTDNYETKVTYSSTPTKWKIGETTYNTGDLLTVTNDVLLEYESTDVISSAVFPENPTRDGYTFVGWYDTSASAGGNKYTSYDKKANKTLYARWKSNTPNPNTHTIYYPDGSTEEVEHGSTFAFPENKSEKSADILGTVTFKFNNGISDSYSQVKKEYLANGWKISTDHYNDGDVITVNSDLTLSYDYIDYVVGAQFPKNPTKNGYTFSGWYDEEEDGVEYTEYAGEEDITLYAQYISSTPQPGKKYILPKNREPKESDIYNVTFNKLNGEANYVGHVTAQYTPNGWLVDNVPYNDGDEIIYEEGMVIVPNYVKTTIPVTFPEDPVYDEYTFLGWYDSMSNGTKFTEYAEEHDLDLYAYWSTLTPTPGKLYNLGVNDIPKDPETFTVNFKKTQNGNVYATSEVYATYTPNGWLVDGQHYDDNEVILVTANTHILPDYTPHGTDATFPEDPTLEDYTFVGWYDSVAGGNKYTSYNKARNFTLYAHWKSVTPENNDILCRRATQLHRLLCESGTLMCAHPYLGTGHYDYRDEWRTYLAGSYGTPGELHDGDAFDCDVNGDGIFDEDTERFYYISDWYDTDWSVRTYDTSYAALVYYTNVTNGQPSIGNTYEYADAESFDLNYRDLQPVTPDVAMTHLPTTEQWPNVSLKSNIRTMQSLNGSPFTYTSYDVYSSGATTDIPVDYTGYAARLITTKELYAKNTEIPQTVLNGLGNGPGDTAALNPYRRHIFENTEFYKYAVGDTDIYTESIEWGRYNLEEENVSFYGAVVMYGSVPNENGERTFGPGITWYPFRNQTASVRPVIDVPKTRIESATCGGDEHTIRYEDGTTETVADGTVITFGVNDYNRPDEVAGTITFITNDYKNTVVTNNVMRSFTSNGWRINDNHFDDGDTYEVHCDIYITRDYIETIIPAEYPDDPFKPGYRFSSWRGPARDNNPEHALSLIAGRDIIDYEMDTTIEAYMTTGYSCFYAGTNKETKDDATITMTFDYQDGVNDNTVVSFTKQYTPSGWLVGGKHYDDGAYVCPGYNESSTVEPDFVEVSVGNDFPEDPTRNDGFEFTGWFDQIHSGTQYTSYFGDDDITFYAHWHNPNNPENYYTVTYGDGNKESVPAGTTIVIPENNSTKPNENYEILYKPENGEEDFTEIVTKKYTANGHLIDNEYYAPGQLYVVNSDTTLVYNYDVTYENAYFPNGVARDGYSLLGWFKEKSGGTRVTTLEGIDQNITLYAHWFKQTDNLCRRAKVLHTAPCSQGTYYDTSSYAMIYRYQTRCTYAGWTSKNKGTTIHYGNLGEAGILNLDDAFTCDVNGDGIYDEETERFYYVGDFFDTTSMTSNPDVAVMVYYSNVIDGQNDNVGKVAYNQTGNAYDGPDMNLISNLPTAEQWSNTTLYHTQRDLIGASFVSYSGFRKGKIRNDNKETLNTKIDYTGYAARLLNSADFMIRPAHITKGAACFDASGALGNGNPSSSDYYRWSKFFCFGLLENTTFNDGYDDEQNRYYVENVTANSYNYTTAAVQEVGNYDSFASSPDLTAPNYAVRPVIDVPKTRINLDLPDGNDIYIDDVKQTRVYTSESYTVPEGTDKASEDIATVTFNYNDGETESTTSKVTKSYEFNNFKLDNTYFEPNDVLVPSLYVDNNEDVRLVSN